MRTICHLIYTVNSNDDSYELEVSLCLLYKDLVENRRKRIQEEKDCDFGNEKAALMVTKLWVVMKRLPNAEALVKQSDSSDRWLAGMWNETTDDNHDNDA